MDRNDGFPLETGLGGVRIVSIFPPLKGKSTTRGSIMMGGWSMENELEEIKPSAAIMVSSEHVTLR
jgi:hypothetical protein